MVRILNSLIFLILSAGVALAQSGEIQGKILDEKGEGVPFANVALYKGGVLETGTVTDFDGKFSISGLNPGNYDVEASYLENKVSVTGVVVSNGIVFLDDITVSSSKMLEDVVIVYQRPLVDKGNTTDGAVVTQEDIENIPHKAITSIAATTAGVYQSDDGGGLSIKGSRADATEYVIDGIRVSGSLRLPPNALSLIHI